MSLKLHAGLVVVGLILSFSPLLLSIAGSYLADLFSCRIVGARVECPQAGLGVFLTKMIGFPWLTFMTFIVPGLPTMILLAVLVGRIVWHWLHPAYVS